MYPSKQNESQKIRGEIAGLLQAQKIESARIRVEMLLQSISKAELLEIVEIMCEKIEARIDFMHQNKEIPSDMKDCISGIIYSTSFLSNEIDYLIELKKQLINKYGKDYGKKCESGDPSLVNAKFQEKFSATIPSGEQISLVLLGIATEYRIDSYLQAFATPAVPPAPMASVIPSPAAPAVNEDPGPYSANRKLPLSTNSSTQQLPPGTNPYYMLPSGYPPPPQPQAPTFPPPLPGFPTQSLPGQDVFGSYPNMFPNTADGGGGGGGGDFPPP